MRHGIAVEMMGEKKRVWKLWKVMFRLVSLVFANAAMSGRSLEGKGRFVESL